MKFKLISGAILAGLVTVFIIQNVTVMDLRFLFWTLPMSGALLMFFILAAGIILGWVLRGSFNRRKTHSNAGEDDATAQTIA